MPDVVGRRHGGWVPAKGAAGYAHLAYLLADFAEWAVPFLDAGVMLHGIEAGSATGCVLRFQAGPGMFWAPVRLEDRERTVKGSVRWLYDLFSSGQHTVLASGNGILDVRGAI